MSELEKEIRVRVMAMILMVKEVKILKPHVDDVESLQVVTASLI